MRVAHYRPDIDGLRGIAILAVLLFHAFPLLVPGGFVGVDMFFVISGYLITGILIDANRDGSFSYRDFYARRVRRIFPALIMVLATSWLLGWFILFPDEYEELGRHIGASALFLSNIVLWHEAGYFDRAAELKPLLHLWSLAVEEQFYLFWPPLLMLVLAKVRPRWRAFFGLALLSFIANLLMAEYAPIAGFFLLPGRFWQLLLGGMLAYAEHENITERLRRPALAWAGAVLLLLACLCFSREVAYPGWRALVPSLGAVMLIAAGMRVWLNRSLIACLPLRAIGLISYPLYLWHWPLLAFLRILEGAEPSVEVRICTLLLTLLLSYLTYRMIERPIRFGAFKHKPQAIPALLAAMLLIACIGTLTWNRDGVKTLRPFNAQLMQDTEKLDALRAAQHPCHYRTGHDLSWCLVTGEAPATIAIFGDSHADHLLPGAVADRSRSWLILGQSSCPPLMGIDILYKDRSLACAKKNAAALEALRSDPRIRTVVLAARGMAYIGDAAFMANANQKTNPQNYRSVSTYAGEAQSTKAELFAIGMSRTITALEAAGKRVIVMVDVPELNFLAMRCVPRPLQLFAMDRLDACTLDKAAAMEYVAPYREVLKRIAAQHPTVKFYDPTPLLCDETRCYAGNEAMLFYRDNNHLSQRGSIMIMQDFTRWLNHLESATRRQR